MLALQLGPHGPGHKFELSLSPHAATDLPFFTGRSGIKHLTTLSDVRHALYDLGQALLGTRHEFDRLTQYDTGR